jgi:hypothetical protein
VLHRDLATSNQELNDLAAQVRAEHQAVGLAGRNMLEHALRAGDALHAAKKQVSEGGWENWVRENCDLKLRCAQVYMQLAAERPQIEAQAQHAAPHSLRAALKLITSRSKPQLSTADKKTDTRGRKQPARRKRAESSDTSNPNTEAELGLDGAHDGGHGGDGDRGGIRDQGQRHGNGNGAARDDIGPDSAGELQRLQTQVDELHDRLRRQTIQITGLESEIEELKAAPPTAEALARITASQFRAIMPPAWIPELKTRVAGHLSAAELVDALEHRLRRDGINASAQLQKIRDRIEECKPKIDLSAAPQLELVANPAAQEPTQAVVTRKDGGQASVTDEVFRGYTKKSLEDLENLILTIQRGRGMHLSPAQRAKLDRMRARAAELKRTSDRVRNFDGAARK